MDSRAAGLVFFEGVGTSFGALEVLVSVHATSVAATTMAKLNKCIFMTGKIRSAKAFVNDLWTTVFFERQRVV